MLENCTDILECEKELYPKTQEVRLLGEITLNHKDIDKLGDFIKQEIVKNYSKGMRFLKTRVPTSLALFLVWKGILGYQGGDYWSAIKNSLNQVDSNWELELGEIFLNFLKTNGLPHPDIQGAHLYVTSILMHGMIPNSCLDNYFEKVLLPIIEDELAHPTDPQEISFILKTKRKNHRRRKHLKKRLEQLRTRRSSISNKRHLYTFLVDNWSKLRKLKELGSDSLDILDPLPKDPLRYIAEREAAMQQLQKRIMDLDKKRDQLQKEWSAWSEDRIFISFSNRIEECVRLLSDLEDKAAILSRLKKERNRTSKQSKQIAEAIFSEPWEKKYREILLDLDFQKLEEKLESLRLSSLENGNLSLTKRIMKQLLSLFGVHMEQDFNRKTSEELQTEIKNITRKLSSNLLEIKHHQEEFLQKVKSLKCSCESLVQLDRKIQSLEKEVNERKEKIQNVAGALGIEINKGVQKAVSEMQKRRDKALEQEKSANEIRDKITNIEEKITQLEKKKHCLNEDVKRIRRRLTELGNGDIKLAIVYLQSWRKLKAKLKEKSQDLPMLAEIIRQTAESDKDGCISTLQNLKKEIAEISSEIGECNKRLEDIEGPFPYISKPAKRFLLHGGKAAEDFLVQCIQIVNCTMEKEKFSLPPESKLPSRVVERFKKWWKQRGTRKQRLESKRRFKTPVIQFHPSTGEVQVHSPPQRLTSEDEIKGLSFLVSKQKKKVGAYQYRKGLVTTEELQFTLPPQSKSYKFQLMNSQGVLNSWKILGFSPKSPLMAFRFNSKKLIQKSKLPKEKIWIVTHKTTSLKPQPSTVAIEEGPLSGEWRDYKYELLNLRKAEELILVDKNNAEYSIPMAKAKKHKSRLKDGQRLERCHSEGDDIYVGSPPKVSIPVKDQSKAMRAAIYIFPDENCTLQEPRYYRFDELRECSGIRMNEARYEILLANEKLLGKNCVGKLTIRVKNPAKNIDEQFGFCILPKLRVKLDKDIYPPKEEYSNIDLTLTGDEKTSFEPKDPTKIISKQGNTYDLRSDTSEPSIRGIIKYKAPVDNQILIPITITIPKLTWKIKGLPTENYSSPTSRIKEIPFMHFQKAKGQLSLIVYTPGFIQGKCELTLQNSNQQAVSQIRDDRVSFDLLRFNDTLRASNEFSQTFALTISNQNLPIESISLFKVIGEKPELHCKQCDYVVRERGKMITHIQNHHISTFIRPLNYEELRQEVDIHLPKRIYKCVYCDSYVPADNAYPSPTSEINQHIEQDCPEVDRNQRVQVRFRIIEDVDEIRQNVVDNLPHIYKCTICNSRFRKYDEKEMINHLTERHPEVLYEERSHEKEVR